MGRRRPAGRSAGRRAAAPAGPKPAADAVTRAKVRRQLWQVVVGFHKHEDVHAAFPTDLTDQAGKPLLSWRVAVLPFVGQEALYRQFKLDEPWDGDHNGPLLARMPALYRLPDQPAGDTGTYFQGLAGRATIFEPGKRIAYRAIQDGGSNTLAVLAAGPAVPWTKPADLPFDPDETKVPPSPYADVLLAMTCDAWPWRLKPGVDPGLFARLAMHDDGQTVNPAAGAAEPAALTPLERAHAAGLAAPNDAAAEEVGKLLAERKKLLADAARLTPLAVDEADLDGIMAEGERIGRLARDLKADVDRLRFDLTKRAEARRAKE